MDTITTMENAMQLLAKAEYDAAEAACNQVLDQEDDNPDAHYVLGVIELARKRYDAAEEHIRRAIELDGSAFWFYVALAEIKSARNQLDDAVDALKLAIALKRNHPPLYDGLSKLLRKLGRLDENVQAWQALAQLLPDHPIVFNNLGNALLTVKRTREAIAAYERSVQLDANSADAQAGLAISLSEDGRIDEALVAARKSAEIAPDDPYIHYTMGVVQADQKQFDEAIDSFEKTLSKDPTHVDALRRLAFVLAGIGELEAARNIWVDLNRLMPNDPAPYQNLMSTANYLPAGDDDDKDEFYNAHVSWAQIFADPKLADSPPHANTPEPDRKLRIAYLSRDFRYHAVAMFLRPILQNHNDDKFTTFCLSGNSHVDQMTRALRDLPDDWVVVKGQPTEAIDALIRHEAIDILIDLGGHTAQDLLQVVALKPAPVQISYLGYCNTTGMAAIDCVIGDRITDPPNNTQRYVEKLVRLPGCFTCYGPVQSAPPVNELPALSRGYVTLASFNTLIKINDRVLDLWARILNESPNTRLLFWRDRLTDRAQKRLRDEMTQRGIADDRIIMRRDFAGDDAVKLSIYHQADISLDAFPWSGHTSSCNSMWMGVPFITLRGETHAGRMAASTITAAGFPQFIAESEDDYARIVKELAGDANRLAEIRRTMRPQMAASPLCDGEKFTLGWEAALRDAWRMWCARKRGAV